MKILIILKINEFFEKECIKHLIEYKNMGNNMFEEIFKLFFEYEYKNFCNRNIKFEEYIEEYFKKYINGIIKYEEIESEENDFENEYINVIKINIENLNKNEEKKYIKKLDEDCDEIMKDYINSKDEISIGSINKVYD